MIIAALQDLVWRRRRVAIAIIGTGLVLSMTMIMTGLSATFRAEVRGFVNTLDADTYVYSATASGPLYGSLPVPGNLVGEVRQIHGVEDASPMTFGQVPVEGVDEPRVILIGFEPGGVGEPDPDSGDPVRKSHEAIVSKALGKPGGSVRIGETDFRISGTTNATLFAGAPIIFVSNEDSQDLYMNGADLAMTFATRGVPTELPATFRSADRSETQENLLAPIDTAQQGITFVAYLLWIVAACVLASAMYLSATERSRDFAVFKAIGVSSRSLLAGLAVQAAIISLIAAAIGIALTAALSPIFPLKVTMTLTACITLPIVALVVGLLASLLGMRQVTSVDPATAFSAS